MFGSSIELEQKLGREPEAQARGQSSAQETARVLQCGDAELSLVVVAEDGYTYPGSPQVFRQIDYRDRGEPDPRVAQIREDESAQLGPQQIRDTFDSSVHTQVLRN